MRAAALAVAWLLMAWGAAAQPPPVPQPVAPAPDSDSEPLEPSAEPLEPSAEPLEPSAAAEDPLEPASDLEPEPETEDPELPAEHRPNLELRLSPESGLMTGDVLTLELRVDALAGDDVAVPRDQDFGIFEVLDRGRSSREEQGDRVTHVFQLELLALEPGETELPPIRVRVVTADQVVGEVETEARTVEVGSVLGNEPDAQPKPATEPVEVWQEDDTLWWVLGGLGLVLLGALIMFLVARWWRRREKAAAPPPPPRPAEEIALEKLEELRRDRDRMLEQGEGEAWVDGVSDAVREYFGHRYGFDGLESTTDEVVSALRERSVKGISVDEVAALLGDCDLVKFARADATEEQTEQMLAGAFRLVRATTPRPGMAQAPPAESATPGAAEAPTAVADPAPTSEEERWMPKSAPLASSADQGSAPADERVEPQEPPSEDDRWMPKPGPAPEPSVPSAAEPPDTAAEDRWMSPGADVGAQTDSAVVPKTMETPSPVREPSVPKTMETPSPVREPSVPKTMETPSPLRDEGIPGTGEDPSPLRSDTEPEGIPSTMPGTDRLIPKTAPPPARDTAPDEPPTDQGDGQ